MNYPATSLCSDHGVFSVSLDKPVRRRPVSDAVKRLEASRKGAGKIESKAQLKHILANANRGNC
ncbi:hypothetical protein [Pseudoalteromonas lipolytica]|uniref:Uncharacterized protein n=1 Tax=Pseudoalteromonas lipolytica TaxID=570156 RepID=A0ABU8SYS0_9GAMM